MKLDKAAKIKAAKIAGREDSIYTYSDFSKEY